MDIVERDVQKYIGINGEAPFDEWENSLNPEAAAKISVRIGRIRLGNPGDHRSVGAGVVELKIDFGPGYRIYLGLRGNTTVILLRGGDKSSQNKDIESAGRFWADYKRRIKIHEAETKQKLSRRFH